MGWGRCKSGMQVWGAARWTEFRISGGAGIRWERGGSVPKHLHTWYMHAFDAGVVGVGWGQVEMPIYTCSKPAPMLELPFAIFLVRSHHCFGNRNTKRI